jgi:hypothetical protein
MASIKCPKCDSLLEIPAEKAGQKVVCPDCGNVTFAPPSGGPAPAGPPVAPAAPPAAPPVASADERQERTWASLVHLAGLALFIPFGNVLGPLTIWLVLKGKYPALDRHGKAAINFQFSVLIYLLISMVLAAVLVGVVLAMVVLILDIIFVITATLRASEGQQYSYPISFHFLK